LDTIIETTAYFIGVVIQKVFLHPIKRKFKILRYPLDLIEIFVPLIIYITWRHIYVIFEILFSMANDFSKASFVAARRLYFEQIAANTNPAIDGRINNERFKRNAFNENSITESSISSTHYPTSTELIPNRNNEFRSKLNSNSKIPIPENHSPLIKSINVDIDENIKPTKSKSSSSSTIEKSTSSNKSLRKSSSKLDNKSTRKSSISKIDNNYNSYLEEIDKPSTKELPEKNSVNLAPTQEKLNKQYEIPSTPPMKPSRVSSPVLDTKSSPNVVATSKLPLPTNIKSSQENEKNNLLKKHNNENISIDKENKSWFSFTKEKAPEWISMAKEKVNTANSWLTRTKSDEGKSMKIEKIIKTIVKKLKII